MLPANLNDLTSSHIQDLIDSEVAESLTLEYKRQLPSNQSDEKREFLYDVAAMANAVGGDIIYGIVDRRGQDNQSTGIAASLTGLKLPNAQAEIGRLSNLLRDGIAPRLTGVAMQSVNCQDGDVLVIRVPRSWNKPHMVTIGGINKFFGRAGTGKSPMSVDEIGMAFSEQSELRETIERWRSHRAELAALGKGPVGLTGEVAMLFHVIPADSFRRGVLRDTWRASEQEKNYMHVPHGPRSYRYNADGFLFLAQVGDQSKAYGYTQLFRSGIVEYADGFCYGPPLGGTNSMILGQELEKQMVNCYKDAINRFRGQGKIGALYVGFSLVGIANKSFFSTTKSLAFPQTGMINQDIFNSPEVFADINESEDPPYHRTILPLVDTMWQVAGLEGTPFKPNGEWNPFGRYQ